MRTTTTRSPSSCSIQKIPLTKRITTATTSATTTKSSKALWNTQTNDSEGVDSDRDIDKAKIKSYSPFQASWKSTTTEEKVNGAEDVGNQVSSLQEDPPKELPIEEKKSEATAKPKSKKFETIKMNINMPSMPSMPKISEMQLPDFPKMETPTMPTMPKIPKMPTLEAPKLSTFTGAKRRVEVGNIITPSSSSSNTTRLDIKTINTTTGTVEKKNYSPLQASWKTTTTTIAMTTTKTALTIHPPLHPPPTPTPTPTRKNKINNNNSFRPKLKLPELFPTIEALPKLPKFTGRTSLSSDILSKKIKTSTAINTDQNKDYSLFQASWKPTTENTPTTDDNDNDNNSFRKLVAKITPSSRSAKNTNDSIDNKKNYSPYQASWKTTTTTTTTTATATSTNNGNSNNSFPMIRLELPSLSLPDLRLLGLLPNYSNRNNTNIFQIQKYNEEAQKLSVTIDHNIKQKVNAFTGRTHYEVGDITKAIIAKVANEEFELAEITFFFRILIAVGADLSGFSAVLPVGGLVGLFGWSISMGLAERFTKVVSMEVNKRVLLKEDSTSGDDDLKSADPNAGTTTTSDASSSSLPSSSSGSIISNSANDASPTLPSTSTFAYTPGDLTKQAVLDYTGKSSYATGDVAATTTTTGNSGTDSNREMNLSVLQELEECLSMEKALLEKLGRIQQQQPQQDVATTTTP